MSLPDIYSIRNKKKTDVLDYSYIPSKLKNQIVHIWNKYFIQEKNKQFKSAISNHINKTVCEVHGLKELVNDPFDIAPDPFIPVISYFENLSSVEEILDVIEIISRTVNQIPIIYTEHYGIPFDWIYKPNQVDDDINARFLENGIGFQIHGKNIVKVDNTLLHKEITIETINLLSNPIFKNANTEYISAFEHFRHKRNKECLVDCLKSIESTMKIICNENGWEIKNNATSQNLIDLCFQNDLIPEYLQSHYTSLRSTLESGVPTIRNKLGAHGQGAKEVSVPNHYAIYVLNLTGTTINFLVSCHIELNKK